MRPTSPTTRPRAPRPPAVRVLSTLALIALAATAFAAAPAPPRATLTAHRPPATPSRSASALPSLPDLGLGTTSSIFSQSDTFQAAGFDFQTFDGSCQPRGWSAEDRSGLVFTHTSSRYLVNQPFAWGLLPNQGLIENMTGQVSTTRIHGTSVMCLTESSTVVFDDTGVGLQRRLFEAYPNGTMRIFGTGESVAGNSLGMTWDPVQHAVVLARPGVASPQLVRFTGNGGAGVAIAGGGPYVIDTTAFQAKIEPAQLAADHLGDIYFVEPAFNKVRKLRTDGRIVTVAGNGSFGSGGDGGPATAAQFTTPTGLAFAHHDSVLYIADWGNYRIRRIDMISGTLTTFFGDGTPATLPAPEKLAAVGDDLTITAGNRVFKLSGGLLTQIAGQSSAFGPAADAGKALSQRFLGLSAIAPDGQGGVRVADLGLNLILGIHPNGTITAAAGVPFSMLMGSQALWFGADSISAPDEVAHWVRSAGYGNYWSQRLTSPLFSVPTHDAILEFDLWLDFGDVEGFGNTLNPSPHLAVQVLDLHGSWITPTVLMVNGQGEDTEPTFTHLRGRGLTHVKVDLNNFYNQLLLLGPTTRFRIVVQNPGRGSDEDGRGTNANGAAVIDNLTLTNSTGPLTPIQDFEGGVVGGGWTLSAFNGNPDSWIGPFANRDGVLPLTAPELRQNQLTEDPSCAWTFYSPGDSVRFGAYSSLASPWFAMAPGDSQLLITFSGKLATLSQGRLLALSLRGKNVGDLRPRVVNTSAFEFNSGTWGNDADAPFVNQKVVKFPSDFSFPQIKADSMQVVFEVLDESGQLDPFIFPPFTPTGSATQHLPILDDVRLYQIGVDQDHDGVANALDGCPAVPAAGQDADGNGCLDPTATMRHVESWAAGALPLHYRISQAGHPLVNDGSDLTAIQNGFTAWTSVAGASLSLVRDADTPQTNASSIDGVNLVTFQDPDFQFPPSVLAVTPTLSALRRTTYDDQVVLPGQIVDADIIFNPAALFSTPSFHNGEAGYFDLQGIVTHEAGHFLGLSHSGVTRSTMFFVLQSGTGARTLETDDQAAIAAAYPAPTFAASFGTIVGNVTSGADTLPIPGALVTAVSLDGSGAPVDSVSSDYTDENGNYALRRLPAGNYGVRVTPLDGEAIPGLTPEYISQRIASIAKSNFEAEWWSAPETDRDDPTVIGTVAVNAGATASAIHVITNVDTLPPHVVSVRPPNDSTGVRIDTPILVNFSERIDPATLQGNFRLHAVGSSTALGGDGVLLNGGRTFIFTPNPPLNFAVQYQLDLETGLTDLQHVHLAHRDSTRFTTQAQPAIAITDIVPRQVTPGSLITIVGVGFSALADTVEFAAAPGCSTITQVSSNVTPTSVTLRVPVQWLCTTNLRVLGGSVFSNPFTLTILPATPPTAPSHVADYALGFAPNDIAIAPGGDRAFAVGTGGWASVNLTTSQVQTNAIGDSRHMALSPDGRSAYVTRPATHDVVRVDADPQSGTFGQIRGITPVGAPGHPDGVTFSPNGKQVLVTDESDGTIYTIDADALSPTRDSVIAEIRDTSATLTGGITVHPANAQIFTTSDIGARSYLKATGLFSILDDNASGGGISMNGAGTEILYGTQGLRATGLLWTHLAGSSAVNQGNIAVGGQVKDVQVTPQGTLALVANVALNLLQVVSIDSSDLVRYHTKVGEVGTGASPVAVACNLDGSVIGTANNAGHSLSIFRSVIGGLGLVRAVPAVARINDVIALQGTGPLFGTGSTASIGGVGTPITQRSNDRTAGAFVFSGGVSGDQTVTANDSTGTATLSLPFRIVSPIPFANLRATGVVHIPVGIDCVPCGPPALEGTFDGLRLSPDEKTLAVSRNNVGGSNRTEFIGADLTQARTFGSMGATSVPVPQGFQVQDEAYTTDGKHMWVSTSDGFVHVVDSDPASPAFGTAGLFAANPQIAPGAIAIDPFGRYVLLADYATPMLYVRGADASFVTTHPLPGPSGAAACTPDGQYCLTVSNSQLTVVSLSNFNTISIGPPHPLGGGIRPFIGIPRDGNRAAVIFPNKGVGVYGLNPNMGPIGQEQFFGLILPGSATPTDIVPAPDGHSVLIGTDQNFLIHLDLITVPPILTIFGTSSPPYRLQASADGRRLWVGTWNTGTFTASVTLYDLSHSNGIQVVSGNGQNGSVGALLPTPVKVRVTTGGFPESGVVLRFAATEGRLAADSMVVTRVSDGNGEAQVSWELGPSPGAQQMTVTALGSGASVNVTANAAGDPASVPPVIVSFGPASGATDINAASAVSVTFSKAMDLASVASKLKLFANGNAVQGQATLQLNGTYLLFQPSSLLPYTARCSLDVESGAIDAYQLPLASGGNTVFTVQPQPTVNINSISPPAGATGIPVVLDGQGFSAIPAQNTVLFNGQPAVVSSATTTSIVATVPPNATTGPVTVQVGPGISAARIYTVLTGGGVGGQVATLPGSQGARKIAITPDGTRAYVTNPTTNSVQALDVQNLTTLTNITVGLQPSGIALVGGVRGYVCNQGSDDVSVFDIDPASATYHTVLTTIGVGDQPIDLAATGLGPQVLVVNNGSSTLSFIDANPGNATFNQVTASANLGGHGTGIAITPDGGRAYVITSGGQLLEVDLRTQSVTSGSNLGAGGTGIVILPDGTLALVLLENGTLLVIDIVPGSNTHNGVVSTANSGAKGGGGVTISPDGGLAYVTSSDGNVTLVYQIQHIGGQAVLIVPGPRVTLSLQQTIPVGQTPIGVAADPIGRYVLVVNSGSGTITLLGSPNSLPPVPMTFDFNPNSLNLGAMGKWVEGVLTPAPPATAAQIDIASVRLNGVVPIDPTGSISVGTSLTCRFLRSAVDLVVAEGDHVPVTVTGIIGTRTFSGTDFIKVKRGKITQPVAHAVLQPRQVTTVSWQTPTGTVVEYVALLHSFDHGNTWTLAANHLPNTGSCPWTVPNQVGDSVKVAVVLVESDDPAHPDQVEGTLAVSDFFRVFGATDVEPAPATLSFAPAHPNPALGSTRLRYGLPRATPVHLELYDLQGRRVLTLAEGVQEAGWHDVTWKGTLRDGSPAQAGIYFVRFRAEGRQYVQRLVWMR